MYGTGKPVVRLSLEQRSGILSGNRDASTELFIDRMPKGTYTLEYEVYLDRAGNYQAGVATIQSVYAPEFSGHTGGQSLTVE